MFFGIAAGVLSTLAYLPYLIDTISDQTQPQRASWFIWSVLASISFFSQVFEGATASLWFAGAQAGATITIFLATLAFGRGCIVKEGDYLVLISAAIGLVLWYATDSAVYALAISITVSLLGGSLTIAKAYREPHSETTLTWAFCFVASICAIASVSTWNWILLAYPVYLLLLNGLIMAAITAGRMKKRQRSGVIVLTLPEGKCKVNAQPARVQVLKLPGNRIPRPAFGGRSARAVTPVFGRRELSVPAHGVGPAI